MNFAGFPGTGFCVLPKKKDPAPGTVKPVLNPRVSGRKTVPVIICERVTASPLLPHPAVAARAGNSLEVTMENARNFEGQDSLGHPQNQVYAVFDEPADADRATLHLNEAGFGPEKVGLLQGPRDAGKLADATGDRGFLAKLSHFGLDFGDQDNPYMQQYKQELEQGRTVLAVVTESDAEVEKAQQVLAEHGARFLTKYGKWAVEALESGNPERAPKCEPVPPRTG
jgi:hypothetical protein